MFVPETLLPHLLACLPGLAYRCCWDDAWTMTFLSDGCQNLTGYPPEALLHNAQLSYASLIHPDDLEQVSLAVSEALALNESFTVEYRITCADGQQRWVWERGMGVRVEHGSIDAIDGFIMDITERKRAEAHLLVSQKMDALGRMASHIAHDFKNLVTVIQSYATASLSDFDPTSTAHEDLSQILLAANRAAELSRKLMSLRDRAIAQKQIIELDEFIREHQELLNKLIGPLCTLELSLSVRARPILADASQLEQILINLALNARDAMPSGGTFSMHTSDESVSASSPLALRSSLAHGDYALLCVEDTGVGIPADLMGRIFEPFFSTKAPDQGSGLGLAMVYYVVKNHGGEVFVESIVGEGTCLKIYLPLVSN